MDPGFNVFYLISDYYYRETFHNDIIAALLSPDEKHGEGDQFINLFIDMINKAGSKKGIEIKKEEEYKGCSVEKEYSTNDGELAGRIDILIKGNKHCIVIENKLNNAPDTYRQLPKYYADLKASGFEVDAFVYMPLDPNKKPDKNGWSKEEIEFIEKKLVIIPAYSYSNDNSSNYTNLIENWLIPAEKKSTNDEAKFIIRQYKTLLNNLTIDIMDNSEIIDILSCENNFETTLMILEVNYSFIEKVRNDFLNDLSLALGQDYQTNFDNPRCIEITKNGYDSWKYIIEIYPRNNQYWRFMQYSGEDSLLDRVAPMWEKPASKEQPFGWDYFEGGLSDWTTPSTLRKMRDKSFVQLIKNEIIEAFSVIDKGLPK